MQTETFFVVQYNDIYGNGDKKNLEVIVKNRNHFLEWLDEHNEMRGGSEPETEEEFNLIPLNLFISESVD
jgi:hypothetical protein